MTATICRTCISESEHYHKLLDKPKENLTIVEMLSSLVPQLHFELNMMTDLICETCVEKLVAAYQFQQLCMESDKHFATLTTQKENADITTTTAAATNISNHLENFPRVKMEDYRPLTTLTPTLNIDEVQMSTDIKMEIDIEKEVNTEELEVAINAAVDWLQDDNLSDHEDVLDISSIKKTSLKPKGKKRKATTTNARKSRKVVQTPTPSKRSNRQSKLKAASLIEDNVNESSSPSELSDSSTQREHKTKTRKSVKMEDDIIDTGVGEIENMDLHKKRPNRGPKDLSVVAEAIKSIKIEKQSTASVSRLFKIPRRSLCRYISKLNQEICDYSKIDDDELMEKLKNICSYGPSTIFTREQELRLVEYVKNISQIFYGLKVIELETLAYDFAKKLNVNYPKLWDENGKAGKDWYYGFMRRYPQLVLHTPEQTSAKRAKSFCKENIDAFFHQLNAVLTKLSCEAASIWNMGDLGFSTVPSKVGKVISEKEFRRVGLMTSQHHKFMITMALAVSAAGTSIPPFYVCPKENMTRPFLDNATSGSMAVANEYGCIMQNEFVSFMQHFIKYSKTSTESPTLLLISNHTFHMSIEAFDMAVQNGVVILSFPPHCSHYLQPLDVSICEVVKSYYKFECNAWMKNNAGKAIELHHIPGILDKCLDLTLTPTNIKTGFRSTGICPFDPDVFNERDYEAEESSGENDDSGQQFHLSAAYEETANAPSTSQQTNKKEEPNSSNRRNGRFPCEECGKVFDRPYRLKRHSSVHSLERPYQCDMCKYRFLTESLLKAHKLMHAKGLDRNLQRTPIDGFKCPDCPRRFEKQASMAAHRQTHTRAANIATYPCPACERKFVNMSSLNEHMTNKHPEVPRHQCNQCEKSFVLHGHLVEHLNRHVGNKNLVCLVCEKEFNYNNALKEHMRTHSGESPYLCPQCGKTFRSGSNLRQHMERHGTEKRYQCTECPSRFSCQSDRIKHMSIHSNSKPHVCDLCGSRFTRAYSLSKHKVLHTGQRPFKCEQCNMTFAISYHLRRHIRTHTGEKPYKCKYCERAYAESGDLTKHLRTHVGQNTYMCTECPMAFKYQAELRKHQSDHFKQAQNLLKCLQEKEEGQEKQQMSPTITTTTTGTETTTEMEENKI